MGEEEDVEEYDSEDEDQFDENGKLTVFRTAS